ncbi:hypothetical protein acsn021_17940 [Anaerocolumna cellulosilytica]|uniref:Periplasmic binding protein domain-containing protein n=1 Tax=Anaerocolumna cellulosilytica TaxID=433286 RepID=A0A6S6R446_9FIRM|nr:substrate-binding domain-containing protein [Anaerocolumna cellulosilytica]MBB5194811.1 ABC-type sugar transport system substrate-binding protein [Anaerocolumna cellulosilytica]BCJ94225.1 hypothetical protein acsn021_17940 [Anaerocolumna cellulosilytica]
MKLKKIIAACMAGIMLVGLTACGNNGKKGSDNATATPAVNEENAGETAGYDFSNVKIGVLGFFQSGETMDAVTAYMDALSKEVGFTYEYVAGSSYDEQTNITAAQNLIASGINGLILCMDNGTEAILEECENAGVYLAGYLTDMESSFDKIKDSKYYLGNVNDGLYDNSSIGEKAAELVIQNNNKKVGVVTFPLNYYPHKQEAIDAFTAKVNSYNETAADKIDIYDTQELMFTQLEDTYFATYPELDSIFGLASGFIYPAMVSSGRTDVDLYTTGFKKDDNAAFNNEEIKMFTLSSTEAIVFPMALLLNEIAGQPYADKPSTAERADTSVIFVTNKDEMATLSEECLFYTADVEDAFISPEGFKSYLTVYNDNANYADLKEVLLKMSMEELSAK